jgi:hypothetical protein
MGMRLAATQTIDASRKGLLVYRAEASDVPSRVWVAFPYSMAARTSVLPETPACVTRVEGLPGGGFRVALHLELVPRASSPPAGEMSSCVVRVELIEDQPGPAPLADPTNLKSAIFTSIAVQ